MLKESSYLYYNTHQFLYLDLHNTGFAADNIKLNDGYMCGDGWSLQDTWI